MHSIEHASCVLKRRAPIDGLGDRYLFPNDCAHLLGEDVSEAIEAQSVTVKSLLIKTLT